VNPLIWYRKIPFLFRTQFGEHFTIVPVFHKNSEVVRHHKEKVRYRSYCRSIVSYGPRRDETISERFKDVTHSNDYIDHIRVLRLRGNRFNDINLSMMSSGVFYHVTHSPSFANLEVLDLRD
jgi:hypothetical protein